MNVGYDLGNRKGLINHLLFIDDSKLHGKNEKQVDTLVGGSQYGCSKHGKSNTVNFLDVSRHALNPIETLYKQHGYLNKNNSRHTVNFFPFSRHTVNFLDVSRHTLNPIETLW